MSKSVGILLAMLVSICFSTPAGAEQRTDMPGVAPGVIAEGNLDQATGRNYYIDSVDGNDSNDGLTVSSAWKSHYLSF